MIKTPNDLLPYKQYILPGVGAFDAGLMALRKSGLYGALLDVDWNAKFIFRICLGMQLLCDSSEEGSMSGLGLIPCRVTLLGKSGCVGKIPHVGFNEALSETSVSAVATGNLFNFIGNGFQIARSHLPEQLKDVRMIEGVNGASN